MKVFLILALGVAMALADDWNLHRFQAFKRTYSRQYKSLADEQMRFEVFSQNLRTIENHNSQRDITWKMGVNEFADYTEEEFKHMLGYKPSTKFPSSPIRSNKPDRKPDLPDSVDWRKKGAITPPKKQGHCGSCWAFASTQQIESYAQINDGKLLSLSAQQLTSCTPNELHCGGQGGCYGSVCQLAFTYTDLFGLAKEADYPYVSGDMGDTGTCEFDANVTRPAVIIRGYESLPMNDMDAVMEHLATKGPLAVAVDATKYHFYASGIFSACSFDKNININHAVQLVGYGTDAILGLDYWLVRNSWGPSYGEEGYIRIKRQSRLMCGTDSTPLSGTACVNDDQTTQLVCGTCGILFDTVYPIGATIVNKAP